VVFDEGATYTSGDVVQDIEKEKLYESIAGNTAAPFNEAEWKLIADVSVATVEYSEIIHDPFIGAWANFAIDTKYCSNDGRFYVATASVEEEVTFNATPGTWTLVDAFSAVTNYNVNSVVTDDTSKKLYKANKKISAGAFNATDWILIGEIVATNNYKPLFVDPYVGIYGGTAVTGKAIYNKDDELFYVALQDIASEDKFNQDRVTWSKILKFKASKTYSIGDLVTDSTVDTLYKCTSEITTPTPFDENDWMVIGRKVTGGNVLDVFNDTLTDYNFNTEDIIGEKTVPKSGDEPFLTFYATGRGEDYNKLSIKIEEDLSLKDTFDFKVYNMIVYDIDANGFDIQLEDAIPFTLKEDAVDLRGESMYLPLVLDDYGSILKAKVNFSQTIIDKLISYLAGKTGVGITFETLFNYDILGDIVDTEIKLGGGSNGSLLDSTFSRIVPATASSLINEFYMGTIDTKILNPKEVTASFVFDIGLPLNNKFDISEFTQYTRNDIFAYLSDLYERNEEALLDFRQDDFTVDNRFASLRCGSGTIFDDYSGQYITVPLLYKIVRSISYNTRTQGVHIPKQQLGCSLEIMNYNVLNCWEAFRAA
ncbi:MAG: hypothetical protein U9Q83_07135, partial [Bacteroidota bacterium]|nr:hypothetical protein [Bacteroidota bacterium]